MAGEGYDPVKEEFVSLESFDLELEHSLVSLSKWESFFKRPFLNALNKTEEEWLWYVRAMTLTPDVPEEVYTKIRDEDILAISDYINDEMTATTFSIRKQRPNPRIITAELVYHWMIALEVPFECQYWHLNRLFALIRVRSIETSKPEKLSPSEVRARNKQLNEQRKAELGTTG